MLDDKGIYIYFISCVAYDNQKKSHGLHVFFSFSSFDCLWFSSFNEEKEKNEAWASAWLFKPLIKSIIFVIMTWPQSSFLIYTITIEF